MYHLRLLVLRVRTRLVAFHGGEPLFLVNEGVFSVICLDLAAPSIIRIGLASLHRSTRELRAPALCNCERLPQRFDAGITSFLMGPMSGSRNSASNPTCSPIRQWHTLRYDVNSRRLRFHVGG